VEEGNASGKCAGDAPSGQDIADAVPRADSQAGGPCAAFVSKALLLMQNPPEKWKAEVATALQQIQAAGLDEYIRRQGGVDGLLSATRRDLQQMTGERNDYGIRLNQDWVDLLECKAR
jgi:hypothetical protein